MARVLLTFLKLHVPKPIFHCTFCKKDGHSFEFCFRRVKHERRVRAKAFRKPHSLSHGTCAPSVGAKLSVDASCSKSQGTSHMLENGDLSSQTMPSNRPLYHYSFCGKDGHQESFCYRRAKRMHRGHSSRTLVVHSPSHGMNACVPSKKSLYIDGLYDSFSSELGRDRGHASSASCGPRHASDDASIGSSHKTLGDAWLFALGTAHSSS